MMQRESNIQNENALVVSGDADTRKFLSTGLIGCGYQAIEAIDGSDTFKKLSERNVEIVISDIDLPDVDGITLCRQVFT